MVCFSNHSGLTRIANLIGWHFKSLKSGRVEKETTFRETRKYLEIFQSNKDIQIRLLYFNILKVESYTLSNNMNKTIGNLEGRVMPPFKGLKISPTFWHF